MTSRAVQTGQILGMITQFVSTGGRRGIAWAAKSLWMTDDVNKQIYRFDNL